MKKLALKLIVFISFAAVLYSCSKEDSPTSGEATVIKGVLMSPNGETPISRATIFVPKDASGSSRVDLGMRQASVTNKGGCEAPNVPYIEFKCSGSDGAFELSIPMSDASTVPVVFQSGAFSFSIDVALTGQVLDLGVVKMETSAAKIAVVTGLYDRMQDILAKLGFGAIGTEISDFSNYGKLILGTENFDLYDGDGSLQGHDYPFMDALFVDNDGDGKIDLHNYDMVFINCGASENSFSTNLTKKGEGLSHRDFHQHSMENTTLSLGGTNELHSFVENGGILYCTDWAYDYIEQTFPSMIDFYGSDDTPANQPELPFVAEQGPEDIDVQGEVLNSSLKSWLSGVTCNDKGSCLSSDGSVHITSFMQDWVMMHGPHPNANLVTWVEGEVEGETIPLTVSFNVGTGKVIYSSYHTAHSGFSPYWIPQERVLQYLVFE